MLTIIKSLSLPMFIIVAVHLLVGIELGQTGPKASAPVVIPFFDSSPVIDGNPNEEVWKSAAQFKNFIQTEPGELIPPSKETIALMGYDAENLYISFYCFDDPADISYNVAKRDAVAGLDYVGLFLDTFDDRRRAYILQFNPLGIQADGIKTEGAMGSDFSPDIVMESKGIIQKDGWSVEVRVPFKSLRYKAGKGVNWGIDFWRRINRLNREVDGWQPVKRGIPELQQLGLITGFDRIKSERTLSITPSITYKNNGQRIADATSLPDLSRIEIDNAYDAGANIKFQITPTVTLDAAINPDFAEVEADAPVTRANERFPLFFPEKRPFFLEGRDYFNSPLQVVNTRNIANPDFALKLTGKVGRNTIGLIGAVDDFPNVSSKAFIGVARYRRDVGENSTLGFFGTQYHYGSRSHNQLAGIDGKFQLSESQVFEFQAVGTYTRANFFNPNTNASEYRSGTGGAYRFQFDHTKKNTGFVAALVGRSKDYRAYTGFTRRTNIHGINSGFRLQSDSKPDNQLILTVLRAFGGINFDESGRLIIAEIKPRLAFTFQNQLELDFAGGLSAEKIYEDEFGARRNANQMGRFYGSPERATTAFAGEVGVSKRFSKKLLVDGEIGFIKNAFDFDFGAGEKFPRVSPAALAGNNQLDPGKGFLFRYETTINYQPTEAFNVNLNLSKERLTRYDTNLVAFDSNIFSARATYQFTRFIFARARWDYETIEGGINGQLLFGWSPSPGTAFYAGYNDNSFYKGYNPYLSRFDDGIRQDGRGFFVRFSYLFSKSF